MENPPSAVEKRCTPVEKLPRSGVLITRRYGRGPCPASGRQGVHPQALSTSTRVHTASSTEYQGLKFNIPKRPMCSRITQNEA